MHCLIITHVTKRRPSRGKKLKPQTPWYSSFLSPCFSTVVWLISRRYSASSESTSNKSARNSAFNPLAEIAGNDVIRVNHAVTCATDGETRFISQFALNCFSGDPCATLNVTSTSWVLMKLIKKGTFGTSYHSLLCHNQKRISCHWHKQSQSSQWR